MEQTKTIGIGQYSIGSQTDILRTVGLGSCIGLTLYSKAHKIGGMVHIMLPTVEIHRGGTINPAKYADTAVELLLHEFEKLGVSIRHLEAKMAGGAQMFLKNANSGLKIGPRNIESSKEELRKRSIPIVAEDVGQDFGRTIHLNCNTGILTISSIIHGTKEV